MNRLLQVLFILLVSAIKVSAQTVAPVPVQPDTLTSTANKGMPPGMDIYNMAKVATRHHYPLPDDVLAYQKQLDINAAQLTKLNSIIKTLNLKKLEISQSMRLNENTLDQMFASRRLNDGALIFYGNRCGLYEGEMRTAVLMACYQTAQVLNGRQIAKFEQFKNHND